MTQVLFDIVSICEEVKLLLKSNTALSGIMDVDTNIVDNEAMNFDPNFVPWIGIYPGSAGSTARPYTLGKNSYLNEATLDIFIQYADVKGRGKSAAKKVQDILQLVIGSLSDNPTLNGKVRGVKSFSTAYEYLTPTDNTSQLYFPMVKLTIEVDIR